MCVCDTVLPYLSAVMSHLWRDFSLVMRIETMIKAIMIKAIMIKTIMIKAIMIKTIMIKMIMIKMIRFFRAPGLFRPFRSSKRVTVKRKHVHKCEDLTFVVFGYQKCCLEGQKC